MERAGLLVGQEDELKLKTHPGVDAPWPLGRVGVRGQLKGHCGDSSWAE